jgi:hypothetical protein
VAEASRTPSIRGRLAEVAALFGSSADFATGMPLDTTFRITGAALRLAAILQLPESDRKDLYYLCLVRLMGCTVDNSQFAAAMGDELEASRRMAPVDMAEPLEAVIGMRLSPASRTARVGGVPGLRPGEGAACFQARLLIEIDGPSHDDRVEYDRRRTAWLVRGGFRVLRFAADDVLSRLDDVLETILWELDDSAGPPSPGPAGYSPDFAGERRDS